jgi:DNA-binding transcriptional LysR family regulator
LADWLVADDLADGRLIDVFPEYEVTATSFDTGAWLLFPSRAYLPARTRSIIDFFKKNLPLHQDVQVTAQGATKR